LQAVLASILVAAGNFERIIGYFIFVVVIFIGLTVAGLFLLRRKGSAHPGYLTPGYPVTPIVFLLLVGVLLFLLVSSRPEESLLGVSVVVLGIPVYYVFFRRWLMGNK
jgi:APA family basic amino acid/polyamine antiporter